MSVQELMSRRDAFNATLAAVDSLEQEIISIQEEAAARVLEIRDRIKSLISAQSVSPVAMPLPAAMPAAMPVSSELREIPFISLIDADRKVWPNWTKCFDRKVSRIDDVKVGDTGSIGLAYSVRDNLNSLFSDCPNFNDRVEKLMSLGVICWNGKPLTRRAAKFMVQFYAFSEGSDEFFSAKKGTTGLWLCKKTSGYYHAPPAWRATEPLSSEYQRTSDYYEHRFSFVVVRSLTDEEADVSFGFNMDLIKMKKIMV